MALLFKTTVILGTAFERYRLDFSDLFASWFNFQVTCVINNFHDLIQTWSNVAADTKFHPGPWPPGPSGAEYLKNIGLYKMENAIVLKGWEVSIITTLSLRFKYCSLIIPVRNLEQANESSYLNWCRCFLLSF